MNETLKLALGAADGLKDIARQVNELIAENKALKAALAQDEASSSRGKQEPTGMLHIDRLDKWLDASLKERKAQRTRGKPWVSLTDEDKETLILKHAPPIHPDHQDDSMDELIEAVGNLLKDKNA